MLASPVNAFQKLLFQYQLMTGEACRELRQRLGIRQAKLCWDLSLDPALISRWESGVARLRPAQVEAVRTYLSDRLQAAKQEITALELPSEVRQ